MPKRSQGGSAPPSLSPRAPTPAWPSLVACQEQPLLFDWKSCFLSRRGASPGTPCFHPCWSPHCLPGSSMRSQVTLVGRGSEGLWAPIWIGFTSPTQLLCFLLCKMGIGMKPTQSSDSQPSLARAQLGKRPVGTSYHRVRLRPVPL